MNLIEKATVIHYHRHRIAEFDGCSVEALGWRGESSQLSRYQVLEQVANIDHCSVLDVGCGYGDFKGYLDQTHADFDYIGIDQMPEFIAQAKERYGAQERTFFYQADFSNVALPEVDYVFASGALSYRCENPDFYFAMLRTLFDSARVALAFNMLDVNRFAPHALLVGHDPDKVLEFCETLSSRVVLFSGYLEDDFTVFVYRESAV